MSKRLALATALLAALTVLTTQAAEVTANLDLNSAYVWRGITYNDGLVFQPSLDVSQGGFSLNLWGNMDLNDYGGTFQEGTFSEVDVTLQYERTIGPVTTDIGYGEYLYPHQTGDDGSALPGWRFVYGDASVELPAGFSIAANLTYEFDEVHDFLADVSISHALELTENLTVETTARVDIFGPDAAATAGGTDAGLADYALQIAATYEGLLVEGLDAAATVAYTDSIDEDVLPQQDVHLFGGVGLAYSF